MIDRRGLVWTLAVCAGMALAGYFPTRAIAGRAGIGAMALAQVIVLGIICATALAARRRMVGRDARDIFKIAMKATAARMILTLLVSGVIAWRTRVDPASFLIWVAITYVILIKTETLTLVAWIRRTERQ